MTRRMNGTRLGSGVLVCLVTAAIVGWIAPQVEAQETTLTLILFVDDPDQGVVPDVVCLEYDGKRFQKVRSSSVPPPGPVSQITVPAGTGYTVHAATHNVGKGAIGLYHSAPQTVYLRLGGVPSSYGDVCHHQCGDGVLDEGEQCDDGSSNSDLQPDACRSTCYFAYCGDHVLDQGEACDDGNRIDGDGCSKTCVPEMATVRATGVQAAPMQRPAQAPAPKADTPARTAGCAVTGRLAGESRLVREVIATSTATGRIAARATVASDGSFSFPTLAAGSYRFAPNTGGSAGVTSIPPFQQVTCTGKPITLRFVIEGAGAGR